MKEVRVTYNRTKSRRIYEARVGGTWIRVRKSMFDTLVKEGARQR